ESQEKFKSIIKELGNRGAEGVILGCTEIPLLIKQDNSELILFDTTKIHSKYAIQIALE
ncbi:MAG: aspartate/glutamate racemase family protein, partial [Bacteroidales bacterium]|nr:aspartate/glutamate racemase family protein [Bacteroidales bacterium]